MYLHIHFLTKPKPHLLHSAQIHSSSTTLHFAHNYHIHYLPNPNLNPPIQVMATAHAHVVTGMVFDFALSQKLAEVEKFVSNTSKYIPCYTIIFHVHSFIPG